MDSITCIGLDANDVLRVYSYVTLAFQIEIFIVMDQLTLIKISLCFLKFKCSDLGSCFQYYYEEEDSSLKKLPTL